MKKLFYVRHGQTNANVEGILTGQFETPLTNEGKKQALTAGKKLKDEAPHIDYIVCSPLGRTYDTAKIIASEIGYSIDDIELNELFLERTFGQMEGASSGMFLNDPSKYRELDDAEGSESIEQLQERATRAFEYVKTIKQDNVLVVSHGAFGRAFRRVVNKQPHTDEYDNLLMIGNAEVLELV